MSGSPRDVVLAPLQALLNRSIAASTEAGELLRRLEGHTLALGIRGTGINIFLVGRDGELQMSLESRGDPEAAIVFTLNGPDPTCTGVLRLPPPLVPIQSTPAASCSSA